MARRKREIALDLLRLGTSKRTIAKALAVKVDTVRRWARLGQVGDMPIGRPRKLTAEQQQRVLQWLEMSPTIFGIPAIDLWTGPLLAEVISQRFAVSYDARYLTEWIRQKRQSDSEGTQQSDKADD